jgi:hypothetical protein
MKETITMFDQRLFKLACGHSVVLGRLDGRNSWTCEECRKPTNLLSEPLWWHSQRAGSEND